MGIFSQAVRAISLPREQKMSAIAASIPTWDSNVAQYQQHTPQSYPQLAHEGYMLDELVFACVEARATSASEPRMAAYRGDEKVETANPSLTLLNHPNPFTDAATFWGGVVMCLDIGGNAYIEKVRSASGKLVELWLLRPDRTWVIPDQQQYIRGYKYIIGDKQFELPAENVIHFKTRHPLDDYYGLPPLSVLAGRIDLDIWVRQFSEAFFRNAGVPAGLLNIERSVTQQERELIKSQFRNDYGGPQGWHNTLVIGGGGATYQPMGLPLGPRGTAVGELDEINEARICMVMGIPPSVISTRIGLASSSYANRQSDIRLFWDGTLAPIYHYLGATLTSGLKDEYPDIERWAHDLSTVQALREDQDQKVERHTKIWLAGGCTWQEYRVAIGQSAEPDEPGMVLVPTTVTPTWSPDMLTEPEPEPAPMLPAAGAPALTAAQQAELLPSDTKPKPALPSGKALGGRIRDYADLELRDALAEHLLAVAESTNGHTS